jgi:hypothetical protein
MTTDRVAEGGGVQCGRWEAGCVEVGERTAAARWVGVSREAGGGGVGGGKWEARVSSPQDRFYSVLDWDRRLNMK